ncbi:NAD-dependent protein deacylase [Treponema sp.]|uniref:NAD-dependent protein deacylase n=1 Tax=Treponema sp. TaxID=166 RepID=UPI003EFE1461
MEEKIEKLKALISRSRQTVFFGGAGVSTESGIPDFRSVDGLYNQKWDYPPETILSASFFHSNTEEFYRFYKEKLLVSGIKPNITHIKLAEMERDKKLSAVITQNIDGLHQAAGSQNVFELHGSVLRNYCTKCGAFYDGPHIASSLEKSSVPRCEKCGAVIKPDVVLYEEPLNEKVVDGAINAISSAELLIIGGTSLTVYPAAGMIQYFQGENIVLINRDPTPSDGIASLILHESLGNVFSQL